MPLDNCLRPWRHGAEITQPILRVEALGKSFVHPIWDGPGPDYDVVRAALRRMDGRPEHPDDVCFHECRTEYGASACSCGHYKLEWTS